MPLGPPAHHPVQATEQALLPNLQIGKYVVCGGGTTAAMRETCRQWCSGVALVDAALTPLVREHLLVLFFLVTRRQASA